jgi:hypothetical protein
MEMVVKTEVAIKTEVVKTEVGEEVGTEGTTATTVSFFSNVLVWTTINDLNAL